MGEMTRHGLMISREYVAHSPGRIKTDKERQDKSWWVGVVKRDL
jgi:hypothetical protein